MKYKRSRLKRKKPETAKNKVFKRTITVIMILAIMYLTVMCYIKWPSQKWNRKQEAVKGAETEGPYIEVNNNIPFFDIDDYDRGEFETYSELDSLGRCGVAYANISKETMPTEERGEIGNIKPSGWKQAKYEGVVDSNPPYLYNRCHLIAYCLAGENDNEKNLITGTRYMNVEGMLPFETEVARYVSYTGNHVLYRVTPIYTGNNLLADGVLMEAYSIEDKGAGVAFCVYCYNKQPGVEIDYKTGESKLEDYLKANLTSIKKEAAKNNTIKAIMK